MKTIRSKDGKQEARLSDANAAELCATGAFHYVPKSVFHQYRNKTRKRTIQQQHANRNAQCKGRNP